MSTCVVLIPEYLLVVLLVGLLRGWLLPIGCSTTQVAALVRVLAAIAGTFIVIPTAGEIPLITSLAAVGLGEGPLGALLITLPAQPARRAMSWRVTAAACGVLAGGLLGALSG